ncbi:hypothetical protein GW17_00006277, partial [Ensete ventricosum]
MSDTYRSVRLLVHRPSATGRFRQKSTVDGRLREKKGRRRRGKEEEKKKRSTYFPAPSSSARRCCPRVTNARTPSLPVGRKRFFSVARKRNVSPRREKR